MVFLKQLIKDTAEYKINKLEEKKGKKYPVIIRSCRNKWEYLSCYCKYHAQVSKIIYTTNNRSNTTPV